MRCAPLAVVLGIAGLLRATPSVACDWAGPPSQALFAPNARLPSGVGLPVLLLPSSVARLADANGQTIPVTLEGANRDRFLAPAAPLAAGSYTLAIDEEITPFVVEERAPAPVPALEVKVHAPWRQTIGVPGTGDIACAVQRDSAVVAVTVRVAEDYRALRALSTFAVTGTKPGYWSETADEAVVVGVGEMKGLPDTLAHTFRLARTCDLPGTEQAELRATVHVRGFPGADAERAITVDFPSCEGLTTEPPADLLAVRAAAPAAPSATTEPLSAEGGCSTSPSSPGGGLALGALAFALLRRGRPRRA